MFLVPQIPSFPSLRLPLSSSSGQLASVLSGPAFNLRDAIVSMLKMIATGFRTVMVIAG